MEILHGGLTLELPEGVFPLSTDSILLADFVRLGANATVLDLCSGGGTLGMLLCAKDANCTVTGVELDVLSHEAALENIRRNDLPRLESICADVRTVNQLFRPGSFRVCVSNPPYFSGGPASKTLSTARREDLCQPEDLFQAAAWALCYGGDFYIVHKPERLGQLCGCAVKAGLEPKRLRLVRHRVGGAVSLVLLQCKKGGKPGMIWEELTLFDESGHPTAEYKEIYHI